MALAQRQALLQDTLPEKKPFDVRGFLDRVLPPAPEPEEPPGEDWLALSGDPLLQTARGVSDAIRTWFEGTPQVQPWRWTEPGYGPEMAARIKDEAVEKLRAKPTSGIFEDMGRFLPGLLGLNPERVKPEEAAQGGLQALNALPMMQGAGVLPEKLIGPNLRVLAKDVKEAAGKTIKEGAPKAAQALGEMFGQVAPEAEAAATKAPKGAKVPKGKAQRQALLRGEVPEVPPVAAEAPAGKVGVPEGDALTRFKGALTSIGHDKPDEFIERMVGDRFPGAAWKELDKEVQWNLTYEAEAAARDWLKKGVLETVRPGPSLEAIETAEGKPPRKPLWAEAAPPEKPPVEPPTAVPGQPELPSGRKPGGIAQQVELPPTDSWGKLEASLAEPAKADIGETIQKTWRLSMRKLYDKRNDLKFLERETGIPVHKWAAVTEGAVGQAEADLQRYVFPEIDKVGKDLPLLERYMVLMESADRHALGSALPGGMNISDVIKNQAALKQKLGPERFAQVETVANRLYDLNRGMLRYEVAGQVVSPEHAAAVLNRHPHYISFAREEFTEASRAAAGPKGRGPGTYAGSGMKEMTYTGYSGPLDQPLARFAARFIDSRRRVAQNVAKTKIVEALQKVKADTGQDVIRFEKEAFEPGTQTRRPFANTNTEGLMTYRKAGEDVTVQIPKVFADIANKVDVESADALTRIFRAVGAPLRAGAVTYDPFFPPVNVIRDALSALFRERLIPLSPDYIRGWKAAITKNDDWYEAAQAGTFMSGIAEQFAKTSDLAMAKQLMGGIQVRNVKDAILLLPRFIKMAGIVSERGTRIGVYLKLKKLKNTEMERLDRAVRTRDATVDFAKSGELVQLVGQMVPFLNAGVQGTVNTAKVFRYNPKQALAVGTALSVPSVAFWLWNQRYETAKMIPDYEYRMNWVVMTGEGVQEKDPKNPKAPPKKFPIYMKIPKGQIGAQLTAPAEMLLRLAWQRDDRSVVEYFIEAASTVAESAAPVELSLSGIMSPLVSTAMAVQSGYDPFRKQTIVPRGEQGRMPEQQFGPETSKTAVAIGQRFGVSPRLIQFLVEDYTAGTGKLVRWMADLALGALGYNPEAPGEWKKRPLTTVEQVALTPGLSRFVGAKNTQADRLSWQKFDEVVKRQKQELGQIPELVRLGVDVSRVGSTVNGKELTVDQQIVYQENSWRLMKPKLEALAKSSSFKRLTPEKQLERVRKIMGDARTTARSRGISSRVAPSSGAASLSQFPSAGRALTEGVGALGGVLGIR